MYEETRKIMASLDCYADANLQSNNNLKITRTPVKQSVIEKHTYI
jgi:hypothetical protein